MPTFNENYSYPRTYYHSYYGSSPSYQYGGKVSNRVTNPTNWRDFAQANGYMPVKAYTRSKIEWFAPTILYTSYSVTGYQNPGQLPRNTIADTWCTARGPFAAWYQSGTTVLNPYALTDAIVTSMLAQSVAKANSAVRDQTVGLGETIMEGKKTLTMITSTVNTLVRVARHIRRGEFAPAAKTLGLTRPPRGLIYVKRKGWRRRDGKVVTPDEAFANNWLAYRYGWQPLYQTVYGSMVMYYKHCQKPKHIQHASGQVTSETVTNPLTGNQSLSSPWSSFATPAGMEVGISLRRTLIVKTGYTFTINNPTLALNGQLGLSDPFVVAWELVPLSFAVDWFLNVGDVLAQLTNWSGKTYLAGYQTVMQRTTCTPFMRNSSFHTSSFSGNPATGYSWSSISNNATFADRGKREYFKVDRIVLSTPPTFGLSFNNGLNTKRLADAAGLLRQLFPRQR